MITKTTKEDRFDKWCDAKSKKANEVAEILRLKMALDHALDRMSRDQQATMTEPTYEQAKDLCKL